MWVGGTAAALWAGHRTSHDADHCMPNLEHKCDEVLDRLEARPGWTRHDNGDPLILGLLEGVMAGVAQYSTVASGPMQVETTQVATPQGLMIRHHAQAGRLKRTVPAKVLPNWHAIALPSNHPADQAPRRRLQ